MRRKILPILMLLCIFTLAINSTYAALGDGSTGYLGPVTRNNDALVGAFDTPLNNIFGTIRILVRVTAVFGIVLQGVRYMYAGPESKGKIKQSLIYIIIGALLVFGVDIVISIITRAWGSVA